ncbi:hypothetical protein HNV11_23690 (plasmid) [Spirosoma taeanense]|uniref:Uncharacterized protein n=1 Tax=Spirosoma taeanense TaxID=2735870 RepID=A0A6M5YEN9_9BACT|nr:hypothetical protein [Spirosoma taeanense]QJW92477.1 hypothetical protein HNV11_23690 [Spirosoma taeanense]
MAKPGKKSPANAGNAAEELKDILATINELKGLLSGNEVALQKLKRLEKSCRKQSERVQKKVTASKSADRQAGKDWHNGATLLMRIEEFIEKHSGDIQNLGESISESISNLF